jgi:hypothetical protein
MDFDLMMSPIMAIMVYPCEEYTILQFKLQIRMIALRNAIVLVTAISPCCNYNYNVIPSALI